MIPPRSIFMIKKYAAVSTKNLKSTLIQYWSKSSDKQQLKGQWRERYRMAGCSHHHNIYGVRVLTDLPNTYTQLNNKL